MAATKSLTSMQISLLPRPKINAILEPSTKNNAMYEMTKILFVLYEKDLTIDLSYM
jgi:hypothetical protein